MHPNFDRDLLVLIHDIARLLRTRSDQMARVRGMTRAQWMILARLSRQPGLSQNELAVICEVEPITIARLVDRLEARGLLERRADPKDRRIKRLHLLPASQPVLEELAVYREELTGEIVEGMDGEAIQSLIDSLISIKSKLSSRFAEAPKLQMAGE